VEISDKIRTCIAKAILYPPAHFFATRPASSACHGVIGAGQETVFEACQRVRSRFPHVPVAILNFASAKKQRGGFLNNRQAQANSIARASALYPSISQFQEMYDIGMSDRNPLHTDSMISSPDVPFFRDDEGRLIDDPFTVSVITAVAPSAKECVLPALGRALRAR
jgi:uncharacterized protein (TIGR02452 family)